MNADSIHGSTIQHAMAHHERNQHKPFVPDCMDAGGRTPTIGASPKAPTVGRRRMEQLPRACRRKPTEAALNLTFLAATIADLTLPNEKNSRYPLC
ncbi:MAG: hypothetical protein ABL884_11160 [Methyloglobulus sp.]